MAAKKGTAAWKREYRSVVVGVHMPTKAVRRIYVQNDGGMCGEFSVHHPMPGRSAEHEALVVFHLAKAQNFPISAQSMIDDYAAKLRRELEEEPPQGEEGAP